MNCLQNVPKDILIKLITTLGKAYSTYIVIHWDRNRFVEYDTFENEQELREFLLEEILYDEDEEHKTMSIEELIKESTLVMRGIRGEPFCVIKGKILTDY